VWIVLGAVELNDQFSFLAVEIHDIGWNWVLPPEFQAIQSATPKAVPQCAFGVGAWVAKNPCRIARSGRYRRFDLHWRWRTLTRR